MTTKAIILYFFGLLFYQGLIAQPSSKTYYYNQYFETSDSGSAKFAGFLVKNDQKWKFTIVNSVDNTILMIGIYLDSAMKIKDGLLEFWYETKIKKTEEQYSNGKPNGIWRLWDEKGRLIDSSIYIDGNLQSKEHYSFYLNDSISMHLFEDLIAKRTFVQYYYESGGHMAEVEFINGREIERKNYYKGGQLKSYFKNNEKGKQIFAKRFTEDGREISEKEYVQQQKELQKHVEKELKEFGETVIKNTPQFDGGKIGFQSYLNQNLKIPERIRRENLYVDEITIKFHLNEFGKTYNIVIDGINDSELKNVIERFFETAPRWDMKGLKTYGPLTYKIKLIQ